jgi:hypothetical protein
MSNEDYRLVNGSLTSITGLKVMPCEFLPDDTIMVSNKTFERLIGKSVEEVFQEAIVLRANEPKE